MSTVLLLVIVMLAFSLFCVEYGIESQGMNRIAARILGALIFSGIMIVFSYAFPSFGSGIEPAQEAIRWLIVGVSLHLSQGIVDEISE
jgi:hypothetical protein